MPKERPQTEDPDLGVKDGYAPAFRALVDLVGSERAAMIVASVSIAAGALAGGAGLVVFAEHMLSALVLKNSGRNCWYKATR
ncbi:MAG TPA: hypothetical protein VIR03_02005 [Candidatus Saccharimonadales bacterium]